MARRIMPIEFLYRLETQYRRPWLVIGVIASWAVVIVPILLIAPQQEPVVLGFAMLVGGGALVGLARQGADVLAIRVLIAAQSLFLGDLLGRAVSHNPVACSGAV